MSNTYSETSKSTEKCRKLYIDHPNNRPKLNSLMHGPGYPSDEYKVLGDFVSKYSKSRTTKDLGHEPTTKKKNARQQESV